MMNKSESELIEDNTDFGSVLAVARKSKNYTIKQISEQIKVPVHTITAIEANDITALPAPTYTQGYIRAYAKFLEIPEEKILDLFNLAVPHDQVSELKPRITQSDEADSLSPIIKIVTILLILAGLSTVIVSVINYYQRKADVMETALESKQPGFTGTSLDSLSAQKLGISQNAQLTDDDVLIVAEDDEFITVDTAPDDVELASVNELSSVLDGRPDEQPVEAQQINTQQLETQAVGDANVLEETSLDVLKIYANNGSWVSVHDANNERLLYNTVPVRGSKVLRGQAPFRVSLGNANSTNLLINNLAVDMTGYIRGNNTAKFTVSTNEENVVFH